MSFCLNNSWDSILNEEFSSPYMIDLFHFLEKERKEGVEIYPKEEDVFNALIKTPYEKVKVVLLGQDPYHGEGQAEGLCFSVKRGVKYPPSLSNIFKELKSDLGIEIPSHGSLENWTNQGVLLLNTVLTVEKGKAHSHKNKGWERFTTACLRKLAIRDDPIVFILWGNAAIVKEKEISAPHVCIKAPHPSPLSAYQGFFGSKPFSKTNELLKSFGKSPVDWRL